MMLAPSSVNPVPALVWDDDCTPEQKFGAMRQGLMTYLGEADAGSVNWIRDRELRYVTFSTPHE